MKHADPFGEVLGVMRQRVSRAAPPEYIMGTVIGLSPFTIRLDTGQEIPNPITVGGPAPLDTRVLAAPMQGGHDWAAIIFGPAADRGYWLGFAPGTQVINRTETPGENIYFNTDIVNTTTDGLLVDIQRDYPDFLNFGTFLSSDSGDPLTFLIEVHLELSDVTAVQLNIIIGDAGSNFATVDTGDYSGTVTFDWSDTWTVDPAFNMLLTVEPQFAVPAGTITVGPGSWLKLTPT